MFPQIVLTKEDTLPSVEKRLIQAITETAKKPGIQPIYTPSSVREEASRLYQNLIEEN